MELEVLSVQGAKPDQVVSIRAGSQRKQAAISSLGQGTPFRLAGSNGFNPFRIDILQQVGSTRLALKPGEGTYSIDLKGAGLDGGNVNVAFAVRMKGNDGSLPPKRQAFTDQRDDMKEEDRRFASQAAQAKEYLESHELLPFVRALLQTVIRDRPSDPYNFIADQFRLAASAVIKPCQPQAESNDGAAFSEPLLKNVIPFEAQPAVFAPANTKAEHNLPIFAQRAPPIEESIEHPEPAEPVDVESLRLQVRDALGQAVEDGRLQKFMEEAASQPFAAKAEPLVVQRKSPPPAPKAKILPEAWGGKTVTAMEAQMELGEARLARMPVSIEENAVEEAQGPLDAMSVGSHEDDLKLAKAHATGLPESFDFQALNVEEARQKREEAPKQREEAQVTDLPVSPTTEEAPQQPEETAISVANKELLRQINLHQEAPQQPEETTISVASRKEHPVVDAAQVTDLPVSPTTEETQPKEDTRAIDSEANDLPVSPTEEVLLPERLERLRQKAQEALLQGAQSGELWSLLQRHAAQKAQSELLEAGEQVAFKAPSSSFSPRWSKSDARMRLPSFQGGDYAILDTFG
ncbi:unnamed protein product [Cladocopium goreaui]|uniref:Uncharacterized protein n=1 Tax=Cladocopium goreaui TaxID=2562237 RepID=A0A9P1CE44_9DINO|nr:unnamed protein product [Cladocopium goreaui]